MKFMILSDNKTDISGIMEFRRSYKRPVLGLMLIHRFKIIFVIETRNK